MKVLTAEPSDAVGSGRPAGGNTAAYDVFISYRRSGGSDLAQLIYGALTSRGYRVFLDVREMPPGEFDQSLVQILAAARDVIVLLTEGCLDRCDQAEDWFREEISRALAGQANVVPFRTLGFAVPAAKSLPQEIRALSGRHILSYSHEHSDASLDNLCKLLHSRPRRPRKRAAALVAAASALGVVLAGVIVWSHFHNSAANSAGVTNTAGATNPPALAGTQPAVASSTAPAAPGVGAARLDVYQLQDGARVPLQGGLEPVAPGTQLSLVPALATGKQVYLLEINGQGHADLYDRQQLDQVNWGWEINGPPASETLLLLCTDQPLSAADRQNLTDSINRLNLKPRVAGQTEVIWENGASRTLASATLGRGPKDVVSSDWQKQLLQVLHGMSGMSFSGVSVAIAGN